ncbi:MAG: WD40 repeat domain-containing protein [Planctomycetes bacterium]|nr:WD40 repeat domain-containing protein [Planctomycetota bacterium]
MKRLRMPPDLRACPVAFSPKGDLFACQTQNRSIRLWDVKTWKFERVIEAPPPRDPGDSHNILFSSDGKLLVASGGPDLIMVWDVAQGKEASRLHGHEHASPLLAFLPDGKTVAAVTGDVVRLWDAKSGKSLPSLKLKSSSACALAFSADANLMAVGTLEHVIVVEFETGKEIYRWRRPYLGRVHDLVFTPDGKKLVCGYDGSVRIWDLSALREQSVVDCNSAFGHSLAVLSPDGKTVALGDASSLVHVVDVATGKIHQCEEGHHGPIHAVAFSLDGNSIFTGGAHQPVHTWGAQNGKHLRKFANFSGSFMSFSPGAGLFASASKYPGVVRLWDLAAANQAEIKEIATLEHKGESACCACFTQDQRAVVSVSSNDAVCFINTWNSKTGEKFGQLKVAHFEPESTSVSCDGRWAAVSGDDQKSARTESVVVLCDLEQRRVRHFFKTNDVFDVVFSPDGKIIAGGSLDHNVYLFEAATGIEVMKLCGHERPVAAIAFSPTGRIIATADGLPRMRMRWWMDIGSHAIRIWDLTTGKELHKIEGYDSDVGALAFSPDGKRIVAGLNNGTALIWNVPAQAMPPPFTEEKLTDKDLTRLWVDLSGAGRQAYDAVWALTRAPKQSVPFLAEKVQPAKPLDMKQVRQWIADLDSDQFAKRDEAWKRLAPFGEDIESELRKALEGKPTLETQRRLEKLLEAALHSRSPEKRRDLRAVWVLQLINATAAKGLLRTIANGAQHARLTREAAAALSSASVPPE